MKSKVHIHVCIPPKLAESLSEAVEQEGCTMTDLVIRAIQEHLERTKTQEDL